ncbi:MAG TPA: RNA methyltransferase [Acidimicrobiales bacterium]|nr:RNA methyltransferase [Acidimicrobiales bacterium]
MTPPGAGRGGSGRRRRPAPAAAAPGRGRSRGPVRRGAAPGHGGAGRDPGERRDGGGRGRAGGEGRRSLGGEQVEGRQAVRELLAAGRRPVREVWVAEDLDPSPQLDEIERLATRRRARLVPVPRGRLEAAARTDAPQGVLALARPLEETDLDELCRVRRGTAPFLLVLDGVTDPHNLGSLLRTAECAGITGVVLPRHRSALVTPTVTKVAAGAVEHLALAVVPGIPAALQRMGRLGVTSIGLDAGAPGSVFDLDADVAGPTALVLGSEGRGLGQLARRRCSILVAIPQHGRLEALNVAAAGAVACFELAHRRARRSGPARSVPGGDAAPG